MGMSARLGYAFGIALLVGFLGSGCAGYLPARSEGVGQTPAPQYKFDYTAHKAKQLRNPLALLLIAGKYEVKFPDVDPARDASWTPEVRKSMGKIVTDYAKALSDDTKELLTTKGFRLTEMLDDQQRATFSQREQSALSLTPKIVVEVATAETSDSKPGQDIMGALLTNEYKAGRVTGALTVRRRVVLEAYEPLTWQLVWTKSLEGKPLTKEYSFRYNYGQWVGSQPVGGLAIGEDERPAALAALLEASYKETLDDLSTFIDVDEFAMLSKQGEDIRKQARGVVR